MEKLTELRYNAGVGIFVEEKTGRMWVHHAGFMDLPKGYRTTDNLAHSMGGYVMVEVEKEDEAS